MAIEERFAKPHSANVMFRNHDRWTLLYQDRIAQLWGRAEKYDDPRSASFVALDRRQITDDEQQGSVTWPAFPVRRRGNIELASGSQSTLED